MQVCYAENELLQPTTAIDIGLALEQAVPDKPVLFQSLRRPHSVYCLIDDRCLAAESDAKLSADLYGVPVRKLKEKWGRA